MMILSSLYKSKIGTLNIYTVMNKAIILFAIFSITFNGLSQSTKSFITPYTVSIKFKNGKKIKKIIYDVKDDEIVLIDNFKLIENQLDSLKDLKLINLKFENNITNILIYPKKQSKKAILISCLATGSTSAAFNLVFNRPPKVISVVSSFIAGSLLSLMYDGFKFVLSGEMLYAVQLEQGLLNTDLKNYCLKRQLNTKEILKGK
jgi:hypothetical protein